MPAIGLTVRNLLAPVDMLVGRVPDDALFYLVLARRLAAGAGFTFDGISPTTGFHPLWLAVVALFVPNHDPVLGLRALLVVHGVVTVVTVVLLDRVAREAGAPSWASAIGAAAAGAWGATAYGLGMETALLGALALGALRVEGRGAAALVGLLLGLTRVDALPLLLGAGRRAPAALVGGLCGVAFTASFNHVVAGEWASTAVSIKALGTVVERIDRLDVHTIWRHIPGPAVAAAGVFLVGLARGGRAPTRISLAAAGGLIWIGASYLFNNLVGPWYFLPVTWVLVAGALGISQPRGLVRGALMIVLTVSLMRGASLPAPGLHATVMAFARDVAAKTPPHARIVAEDFPGAIAWFGERTVFAADGLAASPDYRNELTTGAAFPYWQARGATHYAVTRRREAWRLERPMIDRIAPPFLAVPPSPVQLDADRVVAERADAGGRVFMLVEIGPDGRETTGP